MSLLKIVITGGSGFIGTHLIQYLSSTNIEMILLVRSKNSQIPSKIKQILISEFLDDKCTKQSLVQGVSAFVHLAGIAHMFDDNQNKSLYDEVNVFLTKKLALQAIHYGIKKFVFLSSIKVCGEKTEEGEFFNHNSNPKPVGAYAASKAKAENILRNLSRQNPIDVVIIRPPLVYGKGVKGNLQFLLKCMRRNLPIPLGNIKSNKRSIVFVDNLNDFILTCVKSHKTLNSTFVVSDAENISTTELVQKMLELTASRSFLLPFPTRIASLVSQLLQIQHKLPSFTENLQVEQSFNSEVLGWTPPFSAENGFKAWLSEPI